MERKLFGTDGVRGTANTYPMTVEMALRIGAAAGRYFRNDGSNGHRVVIGKDTRLSGYMFENALTAGLTSTGMNVLLLGASRKRFIGTLGQAPNPKDRMAGSVAVALHGAAQGVQILRVHDVMATRQALNLQAVLMGAEGDGT